MQIGLAVVQSEVLILDTAIVHIQPDIQQQ